MKLVKEITGHVSDAVHKYQTTSDEQRMKLSEIIQGDVEPVKLSQAAPMEIVDEVKESNLADKFKLDKLKLPISTVNLDCDGVVNAKSENEGAIIEKTIQ